VGLNSKVQQRADKHVAADAAEKIEIKSSHLSTKALIWLAA
jgi:hypothetical protein